ncbi:MAG: hypothetical protein A3D16_09585 [Rhodobacterales bacterium RIFCSPHIGHO2_02_FULL_62_130]|nr:MAG: hypothetical protein A3D16_09585 [Rhodobacterales bacterium RIFCSPHIGHO2_02_FULL_62_130]OHC56267.1 MAG: hypothetical protein A3E48_20510 [Rhodobacterales bacterium RIFCSPHIGHO2_12_FULL_62_75]
MAKIKNSFVGGGWGAAAAVVEDRNPVNPDDLVGVLCLRAGDLGAAFRCGLKAGMDCHVMFGGRGAWRRAFTAWSGLLMFLRVEIWKIWRKS